jgi:hypothetical protein
METAYNDYSRSISKPDSAISLELSCFMLFLCLHLKPKTLIDLGSGFSSYVLRTYKAKFSSGCTVYSVDDDVKWLEKTRAYLTRKNLGTENMMMWDVFLNTPKPLFEFMLHDIGKVAGRVKSFPFLIPMLGKKATLLLDDMHKPHFSKPIKEKIRRRPIPMSVFDIKKFTLDDYGRYAWLLRRKPYWVQMLSGVKRG